MFKSIANRLGVIGNRTSIRKRWFVLFVLFVVIPMIAIVSLFIRYLTTQTEKDAAQYASRSLAQLKNNLYYRLDSVSTMASGVMLNLYDTLTRSESGTQSQQYDDFRAMNNMFNSYIGQSMIDQLRLYVPDDRMYASQKDRFFPLSMLENADELRSYFTVSRSILWLDTYKRTRYYAPRSDLMVSCVSALMSPNDFSRFAGVLYVDIPEEDLCQLMQIGEANDTIYLMNANGVVLSHKDKSLIGRVIMPEKDLGVVTSGTSGVLTSGYDGKRSLLIYDRLEFPDWYLVFYIPREYALSWGSTSLATRSTAAFIGVIVLMALGFLLMFSYVLDATISRMNRTILKLEEEGLGGLSSRLEQYSEGTSTLWGLENNVEFMISGIKSLLEETYAAQVSVRNAQLKALQAQINPHFLYNTLDAIKWIVLDGDKDGAVWMINALSRYFRLSLNKGRDIVTLRDEFDLISTYLSIQKIRFDDSFQVRAEVDETALGGLIPKLTLQPIVENALLHGIEEGGVQNGEIDIRIRRSGDEVTILISDNGVGMTAEALSAILSDQSEQKGYGLTSVNRRIKLFYGEAYSLSAEPAEKCGTCVKVHIRYVAGDL